MTAAEFGKTEEGSKPRIGRPWLKWHIDDWLRPSAARYRKRRREVLHRLRGLKSASMSD